MGIQISLEEYAKQRALEFVRLQSAGEWDDKMINEDANALAAVMLDFHKRIMSEGGIG